MFAPHGNEISSLFMFLRLTVHLWGTFFVDTHVAPGARGQHPYGTQLARL